MQPGAWCATGNRTNVPPFADTPEERLKCPSASRVGYTLIDFARCELRDAALKDAVQAQDAQVMRRREQRRRCLWPIFDLRGLNAMAVDPEAAVFILHRFGFGPRPGTIAAIASDPQGTLIAELD